MRIRIADSNSRELGMLEIVLFMIRHVREIRNPLDLEASSTWIVLCIGPLVSVAPIPEMTVRHGRLERWRQFASEVLMIFTCEPWSNRDRHS